MTSHMTAARLRSSPTEGDARLTFALVMKRPLTAATGCRAVGMASRITDTPRPGRPPTAASTETLGSAPAVNSGKTGTLTLNQMTAVEMVAADAVAGTASWPASVPARRRGTSRCGCAVAGTRRPVRSVFPFLAHAPRRRLAAVRHPRSAATRYRPREGRVRRAGRLRTRGRPAAASGPRRAGRRRPRRCARGRAGALAAARAVRRLPR
jgi:hypothetical protein